MANVKMITRTFTFTTGCALAMDIPNKVSTVIEYRVTGDLDGDDLFKAVSKEHNKLGEIMVCMISTRKVDTVLVGMDEDEFFRNGKVLPPRKVYSKDDDK